MYFLTHLCAVMYIHRKAQPAVNTDELAQLFVHKFNENAFCLGQLVTIEFGSQLFKAEVIQMTGNTHTPCTCSFVI